MKNRSFRFLVVALFTVLTQWSCQPTRDMLVEPASQDISVVEAKSWLTRQQAMISSKAKKSNDSRNDYWSLAKKTKYTNGTNVIVLPVTYNYSNTLGYWASKTAKDGPLDPDKYSIQSKLLMFKDAKGNLQSEFIQIIPTDDYRQKNKRVIGKNFSGVVARYDKEGDAPQSILAYKDGIFIGSLTASSIKSGRLSVEISCDCCLVIGTPNGPIVYTFPCPESLPPPAPIGPWGGSNIDFGGSGGAGGIGGSYGPYTPVMLTDEGVVGLSPVDNFFYQMENERIPPVLFSPEEKQFIRAYPDLMYKIGPVVEATGYRPDMTELAQMVVLLNRHGDKFTQEERNLIWEYPSMAKNLLIYIDQTGQKPDGSGAFRMNAADQAAYPKFADLLRNNIQSYVMNTPKILSALQQFSGLSPEKINVFMRWRVGPLVTVKQISDPNLYAWGAEGYIYGEFNRSVSATEIITDKKTLQYYENENSWPELEKAYATFLAHLLIHEMTHLGANLTHTIDYTDGNASAGGGRYEHRFDIAAFGYPAIPNYVIGRLVLKKPKP